MGIVPIHGGDVVPIGYRRGYDVQRGVGGYFVGYDGFVGDGDGAGSAFGVGHDGVDVGPDVDDYRGGLGRQLQLGDRCWRVE